MTVYVHRCVCVYETHSLLFWGFFIVQKNIFELLERSLSTFTIKKYTKTTKNKWRNDLCICIDDFYLFFRNFWSVWASTCIDVYVYTWHRCFFLRIFHSSTAHFWVYFQVLERSLGTFSIKKYTKTTKLNKTTAITVNAYVLKVFTWFLSEFLIIMSVIVGWRRKSWYPASILVRVKAKILIQ